MQEKKDMSNKLPYYVVVKMRTLKYIYIETELIGLEKSNCLKLFQLLLRLRSWDLN